MSYTALYRKMRPKNFEQVIGQQHIVKTLCNQIKSDRINHAYLFCGTRGTGKTSTAKIFAKAINCFNPIDGQPCGECESCKRIQNGSDLNVVELDAASNNSVDNIREIREEVKYPPTNARFKVYIIDEVHMLSIGAFNALLKTLEEPPEHVVFILATTDPQKIPVTIHSRCQRFDFKRISAKEISETLGKYMESEGVSVTKDALDYIAIVADGAMRDALSIIDQCIAFYFGEEITLEKVLDVCGAVDTSVFFDITNALFEQDGARCMEIIEEIVSNGRDVKQFINDLIMHFRNVIIAVSVDNTSYALEFSAENSKKYREQGEKVPKEFLMELVSQFSAFQSDVKYASNPRVMLEVQCIKICNPVGGENIEQLKSAVKNIQKKMESGDFVSKRAVGGVQVTEANVVEEPKKKPKAVPEDIKTVLKQWLTFTEQFRVSERSFLIKVKPKVLDEKLYIVCDNKGFFARTTKLKQEIERKLSRTYEKEFVINVIMNDDFEMLCNNYDLSEVEVEYDFEEEINSKLEGVTWDD